MSRADFGRYWTTTHADKGKQVPGIRRYVVNLAPDLGGGGRELAYDGFAEVWFDSIEDMRAAASTPEQQIVLDDEPNLFDLSTRFVVIVEEHTILG